MIPSALLQESIALLLATDTVNLADATPTNVMLIKQSFIPTADLDYTTLVEADFDGYTAGGIHPTAGDQNHYLDPVTGLWATEAVIPAGGFAWDVTGTTNLPQTIYGYVWERASGIGFGAALLPAPVPLTSMGQHIEIPTPLFLFQAQSPF